MKMSPCKRDCAEAGGVPEDMGLGGALLGESEKKGEHSRPGTNEDVIVGIGQAECAVSMRSGLF